MGWSIGFDRNWDRDIGYGVPAECDHPDCREQIDRGLAFVCGGEPYGEPDGCGLYFCGEHHGHVCERCERGLEPFPAKPDVPEWINWKLTDESWSQWRAENPEVVAALVTAPSSGTTGKADHE
jgi:hypothetical protein